MKQTSIKQTSNNIALVAGSTLLFLLVFLSTHSLSAKTPGKLGTNLYAITGNGLKDTSWIFGTYHLVKSSYLDEVPSVTHAFKKAKAVTVELVLDESKSAKAASMGMLSGTTLSQLLDQPFRDSLDKELKEVVGIGLDGVNQLKPVNIAITLSLLYTIKDTASPLQKYAGTMLDGYFAAQGKAAGKKITELETIEEQMNLLFNSATIEQQVEQLKYYLRNKNEMISQGNELIDSWFKHDIDKMESVAEKGLAVFGNERDLVINRNNRWMKVIPRLLKRESQFIAVGALHLAGTHGLVAQLQQLGYTLTPIQL